MAVQHSRIHPLVASWVTALLVPLLILLHQELIPLGPHRGWRGATLDPDGYLYQWTRNRLAVWAALYVLGSVLLWISLRRSGAEDRLRGFAATNSGRLTIPFLVGLLVFLLLFLAPSEAAILCMAVFVVFLGLLACADSDAALAELNSRFMLLTATLLLLFAVGEFVMRRPGLVERTGGSLQARDRLFRELHEIPQETLASGLEWRSRHTSSPKPDGVVRILTLGDSFTWGDWVRRPQDVWPNVLENRLVARGFAVQVINAGISGTATEFQAELLRSIGWLFEPDVVILQYGLNDTGEAPSDGAISLVPLLGSSLRRTSCLYSYLDARFTALWPKGDFSEFFEDASPGWRRSRGAIRDIVDQAAENEVALLILLFPQFNTGLDESSYQEMRAHRAIKAFVATTGAAFLDIRPRLSEVDPDPRHWWVQPFDAHPNAAANGVAAEAVADLLVDLDWVGPRGPRAGR